MTVATVSATDLEIFQLTLRIAHRNRIRGLVVTANEDGIDLKGEAANYHAIQLVIRDVLTAGVRIRRNQIRVRTPH